MEDRFEATFVIELPPAQVWSRLAAGRRGGTPPHWWLAGFEGTGEELEVDEGHRLRVRKDSFPCEGTEIAVTLEATETGTTVTIVQSGFGAIFDVALDTLEIGWSHIVADFALHLEQGISTARHLLPWAPHGCRLRQHPSGLDVMAVDPGGFGERIGLQAGDLIVTVAEAPVVTRREFEAILRVFRPGDKVELGWVRMGQRLSGTAVL